MLGMRRLQAAMLAAICLAAGCGRSSGPTRVAVGGQVDRAGTPVAEATISFIPVASQSGPAAIAPVENGKYQFERRLGPTPGRHRVLVVPAAPGKRERFEAPADRGAAADSTSNGADNAAAVRPIRWETEVDVPDAAACDLPIHLN